MILNYYSFIFWPFHHTGSAQGLLLTLLSDIIHGGTQRTMWGVRNIALVSNVQGNVQPSVLTPWPFQISILVVQSTSEIILFLII